MQAPPPQHPPPKLGRSLAQEPSPQAPAKLAASLSDRPPIAGRASARGAGSVQVGQGCGASLSLILPQDENSPCWSHR
jgi:hypothetical protein